MTRWHVEGDEGRRIVDAEETPNVASCGNVADKDGDGRLNYEEFATWWAQAAKLEAAPAAAPGAAKPAAAEAAGAGADAPSPRGKEAQADAAPQHE